MKDGGGRAARWRGRRALCAALALCAAGGCAYRTHGALPSHLKTVAVPVFENRTHADVFVLGIEREVTRAVRDAFLSGNELLIAGREDADAILEGQVLTYKREGQREDRYGNPVQVRLLIRARISLYDVKEGRYLLKDVLVDNQDYRPESGGYSLRFGESEEMARRQGVRELARAIVCCVTELW